MNTKANKKLTLVKRGVVLAAIGAIAASLFFIECDSEELRIALAIESSRVEEAKNLVKVTPYDPLEYHERWILNLVYEPLLRYEYVETNHSMGNPIRKESKEKDEVKDSFQQGIIKHEDVDDSRGDLVVAERARVTLPEKIHLSDGTVFETRGQQLDEPLDRYNSFLASKGAQSFQPSRMDNTLNFSYTSARGAILYSVLLSRFRIYAKDKKGQYIGSGPYMISIGDSDDNDIVLKANKRHRLKSKLPAETIRFKYYDNTAVLLSGADAHIIVSTQRLKRKGFKELIVPVGTHWFAWINPRRHQTVESRRWFYVNLLKPAREKLFSEGELPSKPVPLRNSYWFPSSWAPSQSIEKIEKNITNYSFNRLEGNYTTEPDLSSVRIAITKGVLFADRDSFIKHLEQYLINQTNIKPIVKEEWEGSVPYPKYDIVIIRETFDLEGEDPSSMLKSMCTSYLQTLEEVAKKQLLEISDKTLVYGISNSEVAGDFRDIQKALYEEAILFPLFTRPIFIYYDSNKITEPKLNFREGFVRLSQWGLIRTKNGEKENDK